MPRYGVKINSWDGGLNTKVSPEQGALNESPALLNIDFDDIGAAETRGGRTFFDDIGSDQVGLLRGVTFDTYGSQLFAVCDQDCYYSDDPDTTASMTLVHNGASIFGQDKQIFSEEQSNFLFCSDGVSSMYKYDGTEMTQWGVITPSQMPVPTHYAGGGTSYPGDATYIMTYEDALGTESLASPVRVAGDSSQSVGDMGLKFVFTGPTDVQGITYINAYRKLASASDGLYHLFSSNAWDSSSVDATVIDDYSDLVNSQTYAVTVDPTAPDTWDVFVTHLGYMFAAGSANPTWLYYSDINKPSSWNASNLIRIGDGDGFAIRGLARLGSGVVIAKDDGYGEGSVWYLYTPDGDSLNWSLTQMKMGYGAVAKKAMVRFSRYILLLNNNGIYDLEEGTVGDVISNPLSFNIEQNIHDLSESALHNSVAVQYSNKVYVSVPSSGSSTNDTVYVYDYVRGRQDVSQASGSWSEWDNCAYSDLTVWRNELYGATYSGQIFKLNTGHVDYDSSSTTSAIDSYIQTMSIHGAPEHADNVKVWRRAWINLETPGSWFVKVTYADDLYSSAGTTKQIDVSPGASHWGTDAWGVGTWGREHLRKVYRLDFSSQVSKKIQLKFGTNEENSYFKLYDIMLEYNLRGIR